MLELPDESRPAAAWVCLGSPCVGAFVPCYLDGEVPAELALGGAQPDAESPWWRMRRLLTLVERDFARHAPAVRARWDAFEAALEREAAAVEAEAAAALRAGDAAAASAVLTGFMARATSRHRVEAEALVRDLGAV